MCNAPLAPPRTHGGLPEAEVDVLSPLRKRKDPNQAIPKLPLTHPPLHHPSDTRQLRETRTRFKCIELYAVFQPLSAVLTMQMTAPIDLTVLRPHLSLSSGTCSRLCATGGQPRAACGACSRMAYDAQYDAHSYWRLPGERSRRIGRMSGECSRRIGRMPGERSRGLRTHLTHHQSRRAHLVRRRRIGRRQGASDGART